MNVLAFIPARGGSKRIPRKNVCLLGGRPLLSWTIQAAVDARIFGRVVISSDDEEILMIARDDGVVADVRPPALAGDKVRFIEVLMEYLARSENQGVFDAVAVLLPTCPFRSAEDLKEGMKRFSQHPGAAVLSVTAYDFPPDFACDLDEATGDLSLRHPEVYARSTQGQSVRRAWHPNGGFYIASAQRLMAAGSYFDGPLQAVAMPAERSLDLDYPHQWAAAEALAETLTK